MKQVRTKQLVRVVAQALGTGVALSMVAVGAYAQQAQKVEKIEVTGTHIKRVDSEAVAPVEVITRDAIERSGQPTVADVLRNIPANSGGSFSESFSNSFAPGAAGISLRGLGQKTTLVLINGRRTAGYGFAQNLQDSFVDLNSIPSAAVERVEILKDGASAVYGSDAIAGVVNVILRKDYKGAEIGGFAGEFSGKNDYRLNLTGGMGDLAKDRYNVFGVFDYYKRDLLMLSDTNFGHTRDMRGYDGGRNFQSLTGGGTWRQLSATNALTANQRAISDCRGRVIDGPTAVNAGLIGSPARQHGVQHPGQHLLRAGLQQRVHRAAPDGALRVPRARHARVRRDDDGLPRAGAQPDRYVPEVPGPVLRGHHRPSDDPVRPAPVHLQHQLRARRGGQPVLRRTPATRACWATWARATPISRRTPCACSPA